MLSTYRDILIQGLQQGLTKQDLSWMRSQRRYFSNPIAGNTLLLQTRLQLLRLRLKLGFLNSAKLQQLQATLIDLELAPSEEWNPSLAPKPVSVLSRSPDYQLEFYVIPSPLGFDWSNPRGLFWSLRNYAIRSRSHKIGHALVVLKKDGQVAAATGMTGETNMQVLFEIIFRWCGLDVLFRTFRGRLEDYRFVLNDIERHKVKGCIEQLHYPLNKQQFERCVDHLEDWCEKGRYRNYGLTYDALAQNGASCTSYALTYLKIAGLLSERQEREWVRTVRIPKRYFRAPQRPLGILKLLFLLLSESRWRTLADEEFQTIRFWDPDLIYHGIRGTFVQFQRPTVPVYLETHILKRGAGRP